MTPVERLNAGLALWEAGHATQLAAVRRNFPEADDSEILFRLAVLRFGEDLARKAYKR